MKKISRLLLLCVVGLAASCNKEMATPEGVDSALTDELSSKTIRPLAAGIGPYDVFGHGYDVTGLYANAASAGFQVVDIDKFKQDHPGRFLEERPLSQAYTEEYGENAEQYSRSVSNKSSATAGFKLFGLGISAKFNYENDQSTAFDGKYIYGSYNLVIKQKRYRLNSSAEQLRSYLTPEFVADLASRTPAQIITQYGPYVMTDIYTGGKLEMIFQSETRNSNRTDAARIGMKVSGKDVFNVEVEGARNVNTSAANQNFNKKLVYNTIGGNPTKGLRGEINLDASTPKVSITNWQSSVTPENSVLVDFGRDGLIPIYELVADASKRSALKAAFDSYLANGAVKNVHYKVPVYSMWMSGGKPRFDNHILTIDPSAEHHTAAMEGIMFYAYSYQKPGTVPVYRYFSSHLYDNFYTINPASEGLSTYSPEGIAFYAYPSNNTSINGEATRAIYRYWSDYHWDHYWTPQNTTLNNYVNEGIKFYVPR